MDLATLLALAVNLAEQTDEQLAELRANLVAAQHLARYGDGDHPAVLTTDIVAQLGQVKAAVDAIDAEMATRATERADLLAQADAAMIAAQDGTGEDDEAAEGDDAAPGESGEQTPEGDDAPEGDQPGGPAEGEGVTTAVAEAPVAPEGKPEQVAAAGTPGGGKTRRPRREVVVPAAHQPRPQTAEPTGASIIASGEMRGVAAGHEFPDLNSSLRAIHDTWWALRASADGRDKAVLTMDYRERFAPEMTMGADPWENAAKVQAEVDRRYPREAQGLVASGGIPGPAQPRYELITYGTTARPIRDALLLFLAPRGTVTWNVSPTIDDFVVDTTGAAINFASAATDVAGGSYKTVQEVAAPTAASASVESQYARLQHGNFADKFLPELMQAWMKNLMVRYARHNEARRLAEIKTGSTKYTDTPAEYGAYRDLKRQMAGLVAEMEDHLRDPGLPLRVLMPSFVPAMLMTDLVAQAPGDDTMRITAAQVAAEMQSWFPNVNITFYLDDAQTNQRTLTTPAAGGRTPKFDADVEWCCFPEGTWAFLDGGTLDLGIHRDSTLNAANRFQTFTESWEVAAKFGVFSYWITSSLCAGGDSQVPTDIAQCGPEGS